MAGVLGWSWPFPFVVPPCAPPATRATATRCQIRRKVEADEAASSGLLSDANLETDFTPPVTLGGYRLGGCQVAENACHTGINATFGLSRNGRRKAQRPHQNRPTTSARRPLGACAALYRPVRTVSVDVERTCRSFHNFARDHDLFDTFQTGKVEHGLEQDAFEDRAQSPRARLAFDRL